ncbi:CehA/McbA family metallohydrolase [Lentzea sp. NPDC051208]|uniref:CehA/McbA family metallohydrolase n=1 Tax=Lentzea sp. NPDC051208 TaxID=3154642 RepID=UPI00341584D7
MDEHASGISEFGQARWPSPPIVAASWGTYRLVYRVGLPIVAGGTVRIQLPDSWHAWRRNGAKGVQSHEPVADNYVTARVLAGHARIECEVEGGTSEEVVKSNRTGIDGREGRYVYVTRVTIVDGGLGTGDEIEVLFGDTTHGSRGFAAGLHPEGAEQIVVAVRPVPGGPEHLLPAAQSPVVQVRPGEVAELLAYAPSSLAVGERALVRIVAVDAEGNRVDLADIRASLSVRDGDAEVGVIRETVLPGAFEATVVARSTGVLRLAVSATGLPEVLVNPSWVTEDQPENRVFWGDLHSHADHSFDGVGRFPYEYAREVACLDFYALTEHCERWDEGDWQHLCDQVTKFHDPGSFVTFLAYEATFHEPWGHHNVYFREPEDAVVVGAHTGTVLDLWEALRGRRALTVPHHTGVAFSPKCAGNIPGSTSPAVDWQYHDPEFRRAVEIYSGHGQSEFYDPEFDLSYENSDFSTNTSRRGPHYARDAWERGHELGVIGSSDNHRAQPGRGELGLAAVIAPELERGAIFDALHDRSTYATTGARILLDFRVNSIRMGGSVCPGGAVDCSIRVSGTDVLESVEIISGTAGAAGSTAVVASWEPEGMDVDVTWHEQAPINGKARFYYVRVRQRTPYRGRKPTAWSSPIWCLPE